MQDVETGERMEMERADYARLVRSMNAAGVAVDELTDSKGNRTVQVPHEVYLAQQHKLQARFTQRAKATRQRRAAAKAGDISRRANRRRK